MFENGMTIHKFLGINNKHEDQAKLHTKMAGYDWIIVDEAGMVGYSLWKHFQHAKLNSARCKFIFAGDHYQLPPVKEDMDGLGETIDYHNSYV
jgi:ATP-dependent exoDNAse (exonuclease V) alpha subunit